MNNKKLNVVVVALIALVLVPQIALASWWNPFSWFNGWNFHKTEITTENPAQKIIIPNTATTNETSNKVIIPPAPIKQNTLPVAEKTVPRKDIVQPQQPTVTGCTSTQGYSASTGISCSGDNSCINGSFFDKNTSSCINYLIYCQKQNGLNATYDSVKNSCGCATVYTLNNNICAVTKTGYQICSEQFPNETWDGTITNGKYNCVCQTGFVLNSSGTGCEIPQADNIEQQTQNPKLDSLKSQFFQVIDDINTDCNNAYAGSSVTKCTLTEIKLQPILEQEVALGVTVQEVASELSALQDAYNRLQTEYYSVAGGGVSLDTVQGRQANIATEMQILANYKAMFTN